MGVQSFCSVSSVPPMRTMMSSFETDCIAVSATCLKQALGITDPIAIISWLICSTFVVYLLFIFDLVIYCLAVSLD